MPIFMCRWPNGDFSVVNAATKNDAIYLLDEVGNGEGCPVKILKTDFMVHFTLADNGEIALELFGELLDEEIMEFGYPLLSKALSQRYEFDDNDHSDEANQARENVRLAVVKERERVTEGKAKQPRTLIGQRLKNELDAPTNKIDQIVESAAKDALKKLTRKGKTH
jgi:hypothetical protein